MPYEFRFFGDGVSFRCALQCTQCSFVHPKTEHRCKNRVCIGTPLCWVHLLAQKKLRILPSTLPGAGKGLFAVDRKAPTDGILFRSGDLIVEYGGEHVLRATLDERYGSFTAPYGLADGRNAEDGACVRGAGTLCNHGNSRVANARFSHNRAANVFKIVATKTIRNGTEILVNYGRDYRFDEDVRAETTRKR
jgi:hypothetical protein